VLLFRERFPADWLPRVLENLPAVLVDHAHLERKAATSALNLEKYRDLFPRVEELNAIAIEELQHFQLVLGLLKRRGIPFGQPYPSPWIAGLMRSVRNGQRQQVIDHLICCSLIEGRSCEKFQVLANELKTRDPELAAFYAGLVESEGNHYATYLLMARGIDEAETSRRLDFYLELDARLIREPNPLPMLH
jgi:tRNA-(ms[2]io[6]A)-hydroxylase